MKKSCAVYIGLLLSMMFVCLSVYGWTGANRLTWTLGASMEPAVAIAGSHDIHVVWQEDISGHDEIFYKKSTDGGNTWSVPKRLTWMPLHSWEPDIVIDLLYNIHIVWVDYASGYANIYYKKSTDIGETWTAPIRLTWTMGNTFHPKIVADQNGVLYAFWPKNPTPMDPNYDIYYKKSTDGGGTWSAVERLTWNSGGSLGPAVAVIPYEELHVVWYDSTPGLSEIFYKSSTNGGTNWGPTKRLTWSGKAFHPDICEENGDVHLIWYNYPTPGVYPDIYYKMKESGSSSWSALDKLTWTAGNSMYPRITQLGLANKIYAVWYDDFLGNNEIYVKVKDTTSGNWSSVTRLTWLTGDSSKPVIDYFTDVGPTYVIHVLWHDYNKGNYEIYYKKDSFF